MTAGWKIIVYTKRLGGGPPIQEFFIVAIADQAEALRVLRERKGLLDAEIQPQGEVTAADLEWLHVKGGEIFSVWEVEP
jgi:hypothetical protein